MYSDTLFRLLCSTSWLLNGKYEYSSGNVWHLWHYGINLEDIHRAYLSQCICISSQNEWKCRVISLLLLFLFEMQGIEAKYLRVRWWASSLICLCKKYRNDHCYKLHHISNLGYDRNVLASCLLYIDSSNSFKIYQDHALV